MDPIAATWTAGTVLRIGRDAGVQFGGDRALTLRLVSVDDRPTYEGATWVTGYVLNAAGDATARRELYIDSTAGVRVLSRPGPTPTRRSSTKATRPQPTRPSTPRADGVNRRSARASEPVNGCAEG
ncbi:hypothetical protein ACGFI9_27945 [Micromonospora sp. NPDC048930]|uniref:hypothetical protein n=1 Tax=Micromonospora sp. NPDC048930 TaxID=3364261 RepID=UPI0037226111